MPFGQSPRRGQAASDNPESPPVTNPAATSSAPIRSGNGTELKLREEEAAAPARLASFGDPPPSSPASQVPDPKRSGDSAESGSVQRA